MDACRNFLRGTAELSPRDVACDSPAAALDKSREKLRAPQTPGSERPGLLQQIADGMIGQVAIVDADWKIVAANAPWLAERDQPYVDGQLDVGMDFRAFCQYLLAAGFSWAEGILHAIHEIARDRSQQFVTSYASRTAPGEYFQLRISCLNIGDRRYATISRIDISELVRLRRARQRFDATLRHAQEVERQHLARELHDSAGHFVAGMSLGLMRLRNIGGDPAVEEIAGELTGLLNCFQQDIRGIAYLLHPPELQRGRLYESIRALCSGFARRSGINMECRFYGGSHHRSPTVEATIYRIVQEALANIYKHACAHRVRLRLSVRQGKQLIVIDDDGVGLPSALCWASDTASPGIGIRGMIARAEELGGWLRVRNRRSGSGTLVSAVLPLHVSAEFVAAA